MKIINNLEERTFFSISYKYISAVICAVSKGKRFSFMSFLPEGWSEAEREKVLTSLLSQKPQC